MKSCAFCNTYKGTLYPLKDWNNDRVLYYCSKHIGQAKDFQEQQKQRFVEYYRDSNARSYLSPKSLRLWESLSRDK